MTTNGLVTALRGLFWGVAYLGVVAAAVLAFAPAGMGMLGLAFGCVAVTLDGLQRFRLAPSGKGGA